MSALPWSGMRGDSQHKSPVRECHDTAKASSFSPNRSRIGVTVTVPAKRGIWRERAFMLHPLR
jgi:hypothetical protein